jgi:DNA-directed RNA polymerase subunit N (RpoN/RPB10)
MAKKCLIIDRHGEMGKNVEKCFMCGATIGKSYEQKIREKTNLVPIETRQKFLDLLWQGNSIGEAREICEIGLDEAGQIVLDNIGNHHYLRTEAI